MFLYLRRWKHNKLIVIQVIVPLVLLLWCDFVQYHIQPWSWPAIPESRGNRLTLLMVADPQILGYHNDKIPVISTLARWDCDRYLSKTFQQALAYTRPDMIIFLGDLFDEGKCNDQEFKLTYARFNSIFRAPPKIKKMFTAGDNDIGGTDPYDRKSSYAESRFNKYFIPQGVQQMKFLKIVTTNKFSDDIVPGKIQDDLQKLVEDASKLNSSYTLVVNHQHVVYQQELLAMFKPDFAIKGHFHRNYLTTCYGCRTPSKPGLRYENKPIKEEVLILDANNQQAVHEIMVPTCSYRMGMKDMGYGVLLFGETGQVQYLVLWSSHRYRQLFVYLIFLLILAVWKSWTVWRLRYPKMGRSV